MSIETLNRPAEIEQHSSDEGISNFLYLIWLSRPDLQSVFDISTVEGQAAYRGWAKDSIKREYGMNPVFPGPADATPENRRAQRTSPADWFKRILGHPKAKPNISAQRGATL